MKPLARFRLIFQSATLILSASVVLGWSVFRLLGRTPAIADSPEGFAALNHILTAMAALLGLLGGAQVLRAFDRPDEQKAARDIVETLKQVQTTLASELTSKFVCPSRDEGYTALFADFTDKYYAYNPCYRIESRPTLDRKKLVDDVYVCRYKNPAFKTAYYLFFIQDKEGQQDLEQFKILMQETAKQAREVKGKIVVKALRDKASTSEPEFYMGQKNAAPTAVIEPSGTALSQGRGRPHHYLVTTDAGVLNDLNKQFHADWERAGEPIDIFANTPVVPAKPAAKDASSAG